MLASIPSQQVESELTRFGNHSRDSVSSHPALDRGKPRDEHTEGGNQPADKSLINRRLPPHPQPCAASIACPASAHPKQSHSHVFILDREHKS